METDQKTKTGYAACAVATMLGAVLPWASIFIVSVNGFDTDYGKGVLAAAGFGGALAYSGAVKGAWNLIAPLITGGLAIWFLVKLSGIKTPPNSFIPIHVNIGFGVYLTLLASGIWIFAALRDASLRGAAAAQARKDTPSGNEVTA